MAFKDGGSVSKLAAGQGTVPGAPAPVNPGGDGIQGGWQPTIPLDRGDEYTPDNGPRQAPNGAASDDLDTGSALQLPRPAGYDAPPAPGQPGGGTSTHDGVSNHDSTPNHGYMPGRSVPADSRMNDPRRAEKERAQGGPNVGAHGPNKPSNAPKSQDPAFMKGGPPKGGAKFPSGRPAFQPGRKGK